MLNSIALQSFKSFGDRQEIPLEPITVLVGGNNTGKSVFVRMAQLVRNCVIAGMGETAIELEGGAEGVLHRPSAEGDRMEIAWSAGAGTYQVTMERRGQQMRQVAESLTAPDGTNLWPKSGGAVDMTPSGIAKDKAKFAPQAVPVPFEALKHAVGSDGLTQAGAFRSICGPILQSTLAHHSLQALQADANLVPEPRLDIDGAGAAAVLGLWRGSEPQKAAALDAFLGQCVPELEHALVKPAPEPGKLRLWFRHRNGELFDARHVSEGVLLFTALAMRIIGAAPGALIFIEEPEHGLHPRRLAELVELLRRAVDERGCQFIMTTHSPILLNEFRDQPEAILRFQRDHQGTRVQRVSDDADLAGALQQADPGSLHAGGFFNYPM